MDFSIIIPTYNSQKHIMECLKSIYSVYYPIDKYEVIIVDGGSTDNTLNLVSSINNIKVVYSTNTSISNSRNIGVANAIGKYLVFIDSDCLINDQFLLKAKKYLKKYSCYGSFYKAHDTHSWVAKVWLVVERKQDGVVKWITSGTLAVSKTVFEMVNGFDESLQVEEDENFGHRVRLKGGMLYNDTSVASIHLGQADSLTTFFHKETWRGKSLLKPLTYNSKKKTSLFDVVIYTYFTLLIVSICNIITGHLHVVVASLIILLLIPLLMTIRTILISSRFEYLLQIYLLTNIFLLARSWSIIRYNQLRTVFGRPLKNS